MENLDVYDEYMNKIGTESRDTVHHNGLWHKTVHCWMYDVDGNVYFQIRADSGKLYTTAYKNGKNVNLVTFYSGH